MAKRFALIAFWLFFSLQAHAILPNKTPKWADLTPAERQALGPISREYDRLPEASRQRFQKAAQRYPTLSPEEQQRFQSQLTEWVKLKPEERKQAREKYKAFKELPPEKRKEVKEKWHQREAKKRELPVQQGSLPPTPQPPTAPLQSQKP